MTLTSTMLDWPVTLTPLLAAKYLRLAMLRSAHGIR